jgi:hypothetical protein
MVLDGRARHDDPVHCRQLLCYERDLCRQQLSLRDDSECCAPCDHKQECDFIFVLGPVITVGKYSYGNTAF